MFYTDIGHPACYSFTFTYKDKQHYVEVTNLALNQ